jgi:hypothetical protein
MSFFEFPHTRTYDGDLGWLIKTVGSYDEAIAALNEWKDEVDPEIKDLKELYDMMMNGDLPEGVQRGISQWLSVNAIDLMGELIKNVYFGLTNDGYFCAFIPKSWNWVTFDTITDFSDPLYGHLVLQYD